MSGNVKNGAIDRVTEKPTFNESVLEKLCIENQQAMVDLYEKLRIDPTQPINREDVLILYGLSPLLGKSTNKPVGDTNKFTLLDSLFAEIRESRDFMQDMKTVMGDSEAELDHGELYDALIEFIDGHDQDISGEEISYIIYAIADNLEKFGDVDHNKIVDALFEASGDVDLVLDDQYFFIHYLEKMQNVDSNKIAAFYIESVDNAADVIFYLLPKLKELDKSVYDYLVNGYVPQARKDGQNPAVLALESIAYRGHNDRGINRETTSERLFIDLPKEVALEYIAAQDDENTLDTVSKIAKSFRPEDHVEIFEAACRKRVKSKLMSFPNFFSYIDNFSGLVDSQIAQSLFYEGKVDGIHLRDGMLREIITMWSPKGYFENLQKQGFDTNLIVENAIENNIDDIIGVVPRSSVTEQYVAALIESQEKVGRSISGLLSYLDRFNIAARHELVRILIDKGVDKRIVARHIHRPLDNSSRDRSFHEKPLAVSDATIKLLF